MNTASTIDTPQRLAYLDAVRGIAAMAVVIGHFYLAYGIAPFKPLLNTPLQLLADGYAAVTLFFVLSGYVLSVRYLSMSRMGEFNLWGFYVKRYCRIALPFLAVLALSYLVCVSIYQVIDANDPMLSRWGQRHWSDKKLGMPAWDYVKAVIMILPETMFPLVPQAWTLRVEMGMSLALPFLVLIACRSSLWLVAFMVVFIGLLELYVFAAHFAMGILLAQHQQTLVQWLRSHWAWSAVTLVAGLFLLGYRSPPDMLAVKMTGDSLRLVTGVGASMVLIWLMASPRTQAVLEMRGFQFLGRVSYSLYLVHFIILLTLAQYSVHWLNGAGINGMTSYWLAFVVTIAGSLTLAAICYRIVEVPAIALGRSLALRISSAPTP